MFKIIKLLFLILVFVCEKSSAIHHQKRISENLLLGTPYLWHNRIILLNINTYEYKKIKQNFIKKECQIINRKLKIFIKKKNLFVDMKDSNKKFFLDFKFKFKVILIGIDGEIKYQSNDLEGFKKYFSIIDNMPIRQTEKKDDLICY
tara:strand:- start:657 stop:1097 length:441 start_codon:yes stop_codon:yes gene_type:complete